MSLRTKDATLPPQDPLRTLVDRAAIHDLHMRYFNAADMADRTTVAACFTPDVVAQYEGREPVRGRDALLAQIALFANLAQGTCRISTHFAGNVVYRTLTGDDADTEINAFAYLIDAAGSTISMRSLRYLDRLRRVDGEWKICARLHTLDWSCDAPATFARTFARKVTDLDAWLSVNARG